MRSGLIKFLAPVSYSVMVFVNYLAVTLPLGGRSTGEISDAYPNLFAPAGYTFSIWGVIYLLLLLFVIYQFFCVSGYVSKVSGLFIVNALLNALWIFVWHYDLIGLSVLVMAGILASLIKITEVIRIQKKISNKDKYLVRLPFEVYLGWITVATIANITVFLVSIGWNRFGLSESFWTMAVLIVGAFIGIWRTVRDGSFPYVLVLIWAYGGILGKHFSSGGFGGNYPSIIITVLFSMVAFTATALLLVSRRKIGR